jgi:hypothetical protein
MGAASTSPKRVLIVCQLDGYANGVRAKEIERFLKKRGHDVRLVNTYFLSKTSGAWGYALLAVGAAWAFLLRRWRFTRSHLSYYILVTDYHLRRRILTSSLPLDDFDLIICETSFDAGVLIGQTSARTLHDCPTPWADEMYFEGRLTARQHRRFRRLETEVFDRVDHLAFHWESYAPYAVEQYGIDSRKLMTLNWGCTPATRRAEFSNPPRVVYLGSLGQRAIDLPLLSRLAKLYPHIDVYGGPPPDRSLGLNYRGYAPPTVLQRYQIGLITSTRDELRLHGFSAKHPQYLAYGLPVLVPAWRRHLDRLRGSVPYDEQTFLAAIENLSNEEEWQRTSDEAYAQAQRLAWEETLRPLESLLRDESPRRSRPEG